MTADQIAEGERRRAEAFSLAALRGSEFFWRIAAPEYQHPSRARAALAGKDEA